MKYALLLALPALGFFMLTRSADCSDELKVVNLEKINTEVDEDDPFVTPSGQSLYYASNKAGTWDILLSKRSGAGQPFPAGKPFLASKEDDERSPFLFIGGQSLHLYFATNHVPDEKLKDLKNFDIVRKTAERAPLPLLGISEKEDEMHPWLTTGGKEFYFSRKIKKDWVMFVTQGEVPGPGLAKEVGFPPGFCRATLNSTALTMYLQGPLDEGRTGVFRSKRTKIGAAWSKPEPVSALDHPDAKRGSMSPCLSGERLYFSSDRPGGKDGLDIWSVALTQLK